MSQSTSANEAQTRLTTENIKEAAEFIDGDGDRWTRRENGNWAWLSADFVGSPDEEISDALRDGVDIMCNAYVTRWLPGREPKPEKWAVGYVLRSGDNPPDGTLIESKSGNRVLCVGTLGPITDGAWRVLVPPPAPPARQWEPRLVWVSGEGADARVRFVVGDGQTEMTAEQIAECAADAPRALDPEKVLELARAYRNADKFPETATAYEALLNYVHGKDGA